LSLAGADANLFRLLNGDLYLKAGAKLDFETNRSLDVIVRVDDKSIGSGFEASRTLHIDVRNVAGRGLESDIDLLASAINSAGGDEAGAGHRSDAGHDQHASGVVDIDHFQF
jgi:hypothetical protein